MRVLLVFLALSWLPGAALSGAWPRAEGTTFLSFSQFSDMDDAAATMDRFTAIYLEYGLSETLTFGLDAGRSGNGNGEVLAFVYHPLDLGGADWKLTVKAGLGARSENTRTEAILQIGVSVGRGFQSRVGNGWIALDSSATLRTDTGGLVVKSDLTIGLTLAEATKVIVQFQTGKYPDKDPYLKLAPALVHRIGPNLNVEIGAYANLVGAGNPGIKIGTWWEF